MRETTFNWLIIYIQNLPYLKIKKRKEKKRKDRKKEEEEHFVRSKGTQAKGMAN